MRILQVNKFHYPRGGADAYFLSLSQAQREAGHEVAVFCMQHPDNLPSPWDKYFVSRISFNKQSCLDFFKTPGRVLYSFEAKRNFEKLLDDFSPDIIHCHNIYHHLSPSILDAALKRHIPVVMHLHDYKIIAANHAMYAPGGHHCDPTNPWACFKRRCIKDSIFATTLGLLETWFHHDVLKIYEKGISALIAPSKYMAEVVKRYRPFLPEPKVIYNPFDSQLANYWRSDIPTENYLLYFGRLSEEKGIDTLIRAASLSDQSVIITGSGPEQDRLSSLALKLKAPVKFVGYQSGSSLATLIIKARAIVIPSIWNENMPLSLLEAMSLAKVIISSRVGGLPEMIEDGLNGFLFEPGNIDDLIKQIKRLIQADVNKMGLAAKKRVANLGPGDNQMAVIKLYQEIIDNKKTPAK